MFRTGVELVQLDVSVLDRHRRPIGDLTQGDFTILEEGVARPVRAFSRIELPVRRASADGASSAVTRPASDVATNRTGEDDGRLVVILMDRSIPTERGTITAREIATAAVDALGPTDLAAVISTSGALPQNFTADRGRLIRTINQRDWSTGLSPEQEAVASKFVGKDDPLSDGRCLCGVCVLDTVTRVADALSRAARRRKLLLFIGSNVILQSGPRAPRADVGCDRPLQVARERMFAALALSSVTVHSIDPAGLNSVGGHTRAGTPNVGGRGGARVAQLSEEISDQLAAQNSLRVLPEMTGGRVVVNTNGPAEKVPAIFDETGTYYFLAFEPRADDAVEETRRIEVKVSRPGAQVYTQRRHRVGTEPASNAAVPLAPELSPTVDGALRGLLPVSTRPLALALASFAAPEPGKTRIVVNVDVSAFASVSKPVVPLEFAISTVNQTGRQVAFARSTARIVPERPSGSRTADVNVQAFLDLVPGDYEVRVAVLDPESQAVASVFGQIVAPAFDRAPLTLSDVVMQLTSTTALTDTADVPARATTRRLFARTEPLKAVLQVYQRLGRTNPLVPVSVRSRIVDASGRPVRDQVLNLSTSNFTEGRASLSLDLQQLPTGEHTLSVEATLPGHRARRELHFAVE